MKNSEQSGESLLRNFALFLFGGFAGSEGVGQNGNYQTVLWPVCSLIADEDSVQSQHPELVASQANMNGTFR